MIKSRYSLQRLAGQVNALVDKDNGVIQYASSFPPMPGAPDFFHYYANACDSGAFCDQHNFRNSGGASTDRGIALAKAVGEAIERYSAAFFDFEELPLATFDNVTFPCVHPSAFALYSQQQLDAPHSVWVPFDEKTIVRWTRMMDLLSGEPVHAPASMVYMPYFYHQGSGDSPIVQPISTGLAAHCSPAEAALSGACEVIERDALMITWQAMLSPPHILVESLSDENYDLAQRFERNGSTLTILNITMDSGIPVVLSVLKSAAPELPALAFAASSSLDPEEAIRKSLEELAHTRRYCHSIKSWMPRIVPNPPEHCNIVDQVSHLNFWTDQANAHLADFILSSSDRQDFAALTNLSTGDPAQDLLVLCERVRNVGHRVLVCELTTPDVREMGLVVVKVLIPGFHPLFMGYANRSLGGLRLWEVPQKLGYPGIEPETGDNPSPHMYP